MGDIQEGHHEDVMRTFFKLRAADIGMIVIRIPDVTMKAVNAGHNIAELLPEANNVVLVSALNNVRVSSPLKRHAVHSPIVIRLPRIQQGRVWVELTYDQPVD